MYTVLNSYKDNTGVTFYAVKDFSDISGNIEVVSESDLKLLVLTDLDAKTQSGEKITLSGGSLICNVEDVTDQLNAQMEEASEDYDDYYDYDDDEDEVESEEDDSDYDDLYADDEESEATDSTDEEDDDYGDYVFYGDEDEVEDAEGSIVSKLYELLTEEQRKVLKRYYLWYSQRIFTDAQKDPTLGFKNKARMIVKKQQLDRIKGDGDWRYAGWLDTGGTQYGYTCTLGHPLRYLHLAWDITIGDIEECFFGEEYNVDYEKIIQSNHCIVFGSKCIGDFFEVDKECIAALRRTQTDSLKDMAILYDIYSGGSLDEASKSFELLDEIMDKVTFKDTKGSVLKKDYVRILPAGMELLYKQFRDLGMIPPKSLVQEIRSTLVGWTDGSRYFLNKWTGHLRYPTSKLNDVLKVLVGKPYREELNNIDYRSVQLGYCTSLSEIVGAFVTVMFVYELCGIYKYNADTQKDEGGKSKPVREAFARLYNEAQSWVVSDMIYSVATIEKLLWISSHLSAFKTEWRYSIYMFEYPIDGSDSATMKASVLDEHDSLVQETLEAYKSEWGVDLLAEITLLKTGYMFFTQIARNSRNYVRKKYAEVFEANENLEFSLDNVYAKLSSTFESFENHYQTFSTTWIEAYKTRKFEEVKQKKEAERLEREEQERLAKEDESKRLEEEQKAKESVSNIDTPKKVVEYLLNSDLSSLSKDWDLPKNILETVKKSGKEPSNRQFYHIRRLYKQVSGVDYDGVGSQKEKTKLSDRPDLEKAVDYILANQELVEDCIKELPSNHTSTVSKFIGVLTSIKKWGTMSENQLPYAQAALVIFNREDK